MGTFSIPVRAMALLFAGSTACLPALAQQTKPLDMEPLFQLNPTSAADLSSQTRYFVTSDSSMVLDAGASVLQDMGYRVVFGYSLHD